MDTLMKVGIGGDVNDPRANSGDSAIDRLNCRHTVALLFMFSAVVTLEQHYMNDPIKCWHPAHFSTSHQKYADALCWVNNTYVLRFDETVPKSHEPHRFIGYYQWTSLLLTCQAIMFYIPRIAWMIFNKKSGIEVTTITGASVECVTIPDSEEREKILNYMIMHMSRFLGEIRGKIMLTSQLRGIFWRAYGSYLTFLYFLTKVGYCANSIMQLFLLDSMLGLRKQLHGLDFILHLFRDNDDVESPLFPRVAYCDFQVRYLGNVNRYSVQCSLPINLFNEKIFLTVWFWLVFISIINVGSTMVCVWEAIYMPQHYQYVKTRLLTLSIRMPNHERVIRFVDEHLRRDGIFIIYLVSGNSSDLIASELLAGLWKQYWDPKFKEKFKIKTRNEPKPIDTAKNVTDIASHWRQKARNPGRMRHAAKHKEAIV